MTAPRPSLLRVVTCGAVDDGKSTLLGRLMLEAGEVPADEVEAAERAGGGEIDPALLFDGLEAEREQGITIGVAFRTLRLGTRVLRLLDAPGHEQYTGNLATAASQADLALLLVDAAEGLKAASRRHALVAELAGVRRLLLVVNKMDLVGWNQDRFEAIRAEFAGFAERLGGVSVEALPVSALLGANVTAASPRMPWWRDGTLRDRLTAETADDSAEARPLRLPVQLVERDGSRRRYLGSIVSGRLRRGETVRLMPSGRTATVSDLSDQDGPVEEAETGSAISLSFAEDVDLARGDVIAAEASPPVVSRGFAAKLLWLGAADLMPGRTYDLRLGTASVPAFVTSLRGRVRLETAETVAADRLAANELGLCEVSLGAALALDPFRDEPATGAFVLLDRADHATVGAGIVLHDLQAETTPQQHLSVGKAGRAALKGQLPTIVWFTGLSGAGKSTLADRLEQRLIAQGRHTVLLDGDNIRRGLNRDLGFSEADRIENIRRVGEVAKLMLEGGLIVLCAFISPFRAERQLARSLVDPDEFLEVYVDTPVAECRRRDPKGLYARAQAGEIANFTGISSPYEPPDAPELHLRTLTASVDALTDQILAEMGRRGRLR